MLAPHTGRVPTQKQYDTLSILGVGVAGLAWKKGTTEPLLKHGWVTAEWKAPYYSWVRITPHGLRALAAAVEKYGVAPMKRDGPVEQRECAECGSRRHRFVNVPADEYLEQMAAGRTNGS